MGHRGLCVALLSLLVDTLEASLLLLFHFLFVDFNTAHRGHLVSPERWPFAFSIDTFLLVPFLLHPDLLPFPEAEGRFTLLRDLNGLLLDA